MAEKNEYFTQKLENGTLQISEDVVASVAAAAVLEVEGVCGLSSNISTDIAEMLGMKTMARGIRLTPMKDGAVKIEWRRGRKVRPERVFSRQDRAGRRQVQRGIRRRADRRAGQRQYLRHCHAEGIKEIKKANPFLQ